MMYFVILALVALVLWTVSDLALPPDRTEPPWTVIPPSLTESGANPTKAPS